MHIFKDLAEQEKERYIKNIIIITTDNFSSYDYLEEILSSYNSPRFVFGTGIITKEKEDQIVAVLNEWFNNPIISTHTDIPQVSFIKRCLIFTDDMSEKDTINLSTEAKSIIPEYHVEICRKKTSAELIEIEAKRNIQQKQYNKKEIIERAGIALMFIAFIGVFVAMVVNDSFLYVVTVIFAIIIMSVFWGGILTISYLLYSGLCPKKVNDKKITTVIKTMLGTLVIAGIIILVIWLLSSIFGDNTYINDAHRPDKW
ncbi:MAG: hypothetical protein SNH27_17060 [Rikenellaceae bacterium]